MSADSKPLPSSSARDADPEKASVDHAENPNTEGTYHQSKLPPRVWYKALVTKLNPEHSAAVHADADQVVYTEAEEKKVRRKIDRVVLPLIVCSYICKISPHLWESCR